MYRRPAFDAGENGSATLVLRPDQRARLRSVGVLRGADTIECGRERHRLSVRDDDLHTHDHDATAELALHALGGNLPTCLIYLLVWRQSFRDGFLRFWAENERLDPLERTHLRREWVDNYWEGWPPEPPAAAVLFEQPWQDALGAAVARRAAASGDADRIRSAHRAVQVRLRTAFVKSIAGVPAHRKPDALVPLTVVVGSVRPAVQGRLARAGSHVEVRVAPDWLWTIWAPGIAVVDNQLVLDLDVGNDAFDSVAWRRTGGNDHEHAPSLVRMGGRELRAARASRAGGR